MDPNLNKPPEASWSWSMFPGSRIEAARMSIPLACTYAPLQELKMAPLGVEPQMCRTCKAILNPFCMPEFRSLTWLCPFCNTKNNFPQQYHSMNESFVVPELQPMNSTIEYHVKRAPVPEPFYIFLIDLCVGSANPSDMEDLRETLLKAINFLPQNATVAVITFGTAISVHEIGASSPDLPGRVFTLKGSKSYTTDQVAKFLRLEIPGGPVGEKQPTHAPGTLRNDFFGTLSDVESNMNDIFEGLEPDPWPVKAGCRQRRCTGAALSVAIGLAEAVYPNCGGRIMLFLSGPCTEGPGMTVDTDFSNIMRGHNDIKTSTPEAKHWSKSRQYYDALSAKLVRNGHCLDAFLNALDQVGFAEMRSCTALTGGTCLLADAFSNEKFVDSFQKFFRVDETGGFPRAYNARIEVQCSPHWKVAGATGPLTSSKKKSESVAQDTEMGIGGTCEWLMPTVDDRTHLAFYFEVASKPGDFRFVQFTTRYQHWSGGYRLRVTTLSHKIAKPDTKVSDYIPCFDQEVASVLMARLATHKAEDGHIFDVLRWLDGHIIKLVSRFAKYTRDQPASLTLAKEMALFPQFMFHLRRGQFLQVFNSSPDETCFYRLWLDREDPKEALIMIQPVVFTYTAEEGGPRPASLDSSSVSVNAILLLDTYFEVVVHYGEVIVAWRNQGFHEQPEYEHFAALLKQPKAAALLRVNKRYPQPRFVECDHHTSQARLLYNVINPSATHNQSQEEYGSKDRGEIVYTDDASLETFLKSLRSLAVQN